jgi:hypothetical protein
VRAPARLTRSSPSAAALAAGAATVIALLSAWGSARDEWRRLGDGRATFAAYSDTRRDEAPINGAGFTSLARLFAVAATEVGRGDRIYFQVPRTPFGTLDLHDTVAALGRLYLLPAVEVSDVGDATLVVSFQADPADLHRPFLSQRQYGTAFVSRLASR